MFLETSLAKLPEELAVGTQESARCQWCDSELNEGDVITVLFSKIDGVGHWEVHRTYCTGCGPSAIADPVIGCTKLLAQCRLDILTDLATQPTELVVLEPKLIDLSEPIEGQSAIGSDENTDQDTSAEPLASSSDGVEVETLPPHLGTPATHRPTVTDSSVRLEDQLVPNGGAE
ncbi:hypothetical protein [Natronococcus roseus]|uniref:hypothetical protein n=1 Tax=Natronococcus roseus TaxID=1052014 RepID=UPI00374DE2EB